MARCFSLILIIVIVAISVSLSCGLKENQLSYDYYKSSCPNIEMVVKTEMLSIFLTDATAPAAFLRLMFHDCQVQVILFPPSLSLILFFTTSSKNFGIRKREVINHIKSVLEEACPGQVSCVDIIVLAAKESVSFSGGPDIRIPLGRKDSRTCSFKKADAQLPPPAITVDELISIFMSKGMNIEESVAILGAHTLGVGHCLNIVRRLYDPQPGDKMDLAFEASLRITCPTSIPLTNLSFVPNDITPTIFHNQYYRDILMGRGLFGIDSSISRDSRTAPFVKQFAMDQNYFFQVFSSAFVKLSSTNVLTTEQGEVRRQCNRVN
ncbi:hypothetical protein L6164_035943 [Bauhinia variegata]|uniref:Uncharacterized protein n=1 Tax=Bauhinia variegata TaxID=167791 RepID=A0ACB9KFM1_BAUVA|nr:hypothetical protein L6164_035943 [Bauhinia variegata]